MLERPISHHSRCCPARGSWESVCVTRNDYDFRYTPAPDVPPHGSARFPPWRSCATSSDLYRRNTHRHRTSSRKLNRIHGCPLRFIPGIPRRDFDTTSKVFVAFQSPIPRQCEIIRYSRLTCAIVAPVSENGTPFTRLNFRCLEVDVVCWDAGSHDFEYHSARTRTGRTTSSTVNGTDSCTNDETLGSLKSLNSFILPYDWITQ